MTIETWRLPDRLAAVVAAPHRGLSLFWLGQAGFLLRHHDAVLLIDP